MSSPIPFNIPQQHPFDSNSAHEWEYYSVRGNIKTHIINPN